MNPYDLLDVAPTASEAEIRAAWKSAIADLEPGDRRFRAYNQAAELLLDPAQRAAYDAELAAAELEAEPALETPPVASTDAPPVGSSVSQDPVPVAGRSGVPMWLLLGLAVVTATVIGFTVYLTTQPSDGAVEKSTRAAQSAAERAIVPVLSYDAATLDQDQEDAQAVMTSDYRTEYDKLFEVIKQNAPSTGTKVDAEVIASGIVRSGDDRVDILLFVNRPTTNKQQDEPVIYKDQVTVTMQLVGGDWLVDDLTTSPVSR